MSDERKKSVWPWSVSVLITLPFLYIASFGPACWISERTGIGEQAISKVFWPMVWFAEKNLRAREVVLWYASVGVTSGDSAFIVKNEIHWKKRVYADFTSLALLIQSTIEPSTGDLSTGLDEAATDGEED